MTWTSNVRSCGGSPGCMQCASKARFVGFFLRRLYLFGLFLPLFCMRCFGSRDLCLHLFGVCNSKMAECESCLLTVPLCARAHAHTHALCPCPATEQLWHCYNVISPPHPHYTLPPLLPPEGLGILIRKCASLPRCRRPGLPFRLFLLVFYYVFNAKFGCVAR